MSFIFLVRFIPKYFSLGGVQFKKFLCFLTFALAYFIVSINQCNQFMYINLESCYLAKFVYQSW